MVHVETASMPNYLLNNLRKKMLRHLARNMSGGDLLGVVSATECDAAKRHNE